MGVTPETLILSDSTDTQIRKKNNYKKENQKKEKGTKSLDLYSTDSRWNRQLKLTDGRNSNG